METELSDVDLAVLLDDLPEDLLGVYLSLVDDLSVILGDNVDLVFLNEAPPSSDTMSSNMGLYFTEEVRRRG